MLLGYSVVISSLENIDFGNPDNKVNLYAIFLKYLSVDWIIEI